MKHVKTFGRGEEGKEMYVKVKRGDNREMEGRNQGGTNPPWKNFRLSP